MGLSLSRRRRGPRVALCASVAVTIFLAGSLLMLRVFENKFIFHPEVTPRSSTTELGGGVRVEDVRVETPDGVELHGWRAGSFDDGPVLLFIHGNAGNVTHRARRVAGFASHGLGVLIFDYRGYGQSEGRPDERGVYEDARAMHGHLVERVGVAPERIVLLGRSLGGAVAVNLAAERPAAALVVESSFTSGREMARRLFRPLPVHLLMRSRFDSLSRVSRLRLPKLFLHGRRDDVVPFEMGRRLYEAAAEPKRWVGFEEADHNDAPWSVGERYFEIVARFAREHAAGRR